MALPGRAQFVDSLRLHLQQKPRFLFRLDSRNSFISNVPVRVFGLQAGWEYNSKIRLGLGINILNSTISKSLLVRGKDGSLQEVNSQLRFSYISPFFEYVFFQNKRWEHSIPVQIGIGNTRYVYTLGDGVLLNSSYRPIILYEPAMTTHFKVFSWIGIGGGVGYRLVLMNNRAAGVNFNAPVYVVKVKLFLGDLYRWVRGSSGVRQ